MAELQNHDRPRGPRRLTDKQRSDVVQAETRAKAVGDRYAELHGLLTSTARARAALAEAVAAAGALLAADDGPEPNVTAMADAASAAELCLDALDGPALEGLSAQVAQLEQRYLAQGHREMHEAVKVSILRERGWSSPRIAYELIDWDSVAADDRGWDAARSDLYRAAVDRISRYVSQG